MMNQEILRQCDIFSGLTTGELKKIAEMTAEREYEAGSTIFQEQDRADQLFVLKEGKVALQMVSAMPPGRTVTVDVVSMGDLVGWAPLVEPHIHEVRALCLQKSRLLAIDTSLLRQLFKENGQTHIGVMKGMVHAALQRLNDTRQLLISERLFLQKIE